MPQKWGTQLCVAPDDNSAWARRFVGPHKEKHMDALTMPTPEELEAEAVELEKRAGTKERIAAQSWMSQASRDIMLKDAGYFREEAEMKRAKAERIITREIEAGLRTPSGTLVTTIESMEAQGLKVWHQHLREIGGMPEEVAPDSEDWAADSVDPRDL